MKICRPSTRSSFDWASLLRSYKSHVTSSATVLEIGASSVERTVDLSACCGNLIGVEIAPDRKPEDFGNVRYQVGDWQRLSEFIQPGSIDIAVSSHVIEHVQDDEKAIDELYTVLKPGGVALLNTPNRKRLVRAVVEVFSGERRFPFWEHQREYTEEDLLRLLKASRFERFEILPIAFGLLGGPVFWYFESVPRGFRRYANFWEIHLHRD